MILIIATNGFDGAAYPARRRAALKAVLAGLFRRPGEPTFGAAVGYYPGCDPPSSALETDTLILIGDAEDSTPVARRPLARHGQDE